MKEIPAVNRTVTTRKLCVAPSLFNFTLMHLQNTASRAVLSV